MFTLAPKWKWLRGKNKTKQKNSKNNETLILDTEKPENMF